MNAPTSPIQCPKCLWWYSAHNEGPHTCPSHHNLAEELAELRAFKAAALITLEVPAPPQATIGRTDREGGFNAARMYAPEEFAAQPQRSGDALRLLAELFAESLHQTWTRGEIVNILEDAIRLGSSHARPDEWEALRGAAPNATGDLSSEEFIRQQRSEWDNDDPEVTRPESETPAIMQFTPKPDCPHCKGHGRVGVMACWHCGATGQALTSHVSKAIENTGE